MQVIISVALPDAVLAENPQDGLFDGPAPEVVAVVVRVRTVHGRLVERCRSVGLDEIDVLILLDRNLHQAVGHVLLGSLEVVVAAVEIAGFAIDGLLEDQRLARVGGLEALDEREEPLVDHVRGRI